MKQALLVAGQEFIANLRRPGFIIMTLSIPVLGLIVLAIASLFGGQVGDFFENQFTGDVKVTGYVDNSGVLDAELAQYATEFVPYTDEESARAALLAEEIDNYIVLPADYLETGVVTAYNQEGGFSAFASADSGNLRAFLIDSLLSGKIDGATQARVLSPMNLEVVALDDTGEVTSESPFSWLGDFVLPYVFSILFVMTIFTTSGFLLQGVSEEKEGRIIEILLSSISSTQLLTGKILGLGALGLLQVFIWISAGAALLVGAISMFALAGVIKLSVGTVLLGVLYFVLGYLLFATLMAVAGSMGTTQRESQQIAGIFSMAAAIPWMTMGIVFSNPDSPIAIVLSYVPLTSPVMMLLRMSISQVPPEQIAISLILLIAGIALSLWGGAKIFRTSLLMYGKRPGLKDLARAFRQA